MTDNWNDPARGNEPEYRNEPENNAVPNNSGPYNSGPYNAVPYDGFGQPLPDHVGQRSAPTGKQLLLATWQLLRQDRQMLWLPVISGVSSLLAIAVLAGPFLLAASVRDHGPHSPLGVVAVVVIAIVGTTIGVFFQSAMAIAANERADGRTPTLGGVLGQAWSRRRQILGWALLSATVGLIYRAIEERAGILGKLLGFLGILAWAVASFLVVPVLVSEDLGPIEALKRSSAVLKRTWGTSVRSGLRFGAAQLVAVLVIVTGFFIGFFVLIAANGNAAGLLVGGLVVAASVISLLALSVISSAVTIYARTLIYRYATGRPVPGIDPALFAGAMRAKKKRFGRG